MKAAAILSWAGIFVFAMCCAAGGLFYGYSEGLEDGAASVTDTTHVIHEDTMHIIVHIPLDSLPDCKVLCLQAAFLDSMSESRED